MKPTPNTRRPLLLHISSDYTDGLGDKAAHRNRRPTLAINNLVEGAEEFDHVVFSLRRRPSPVGLFLIDEGTPKRENVRVFVYGHFGLPLGIGLFHSFWTVARTIRRVLQEQQLKPALVHAHKLTFEGIAGWLLARTIGIPLVVSIRGEAESKIFKFKPTYKPLMRRILAYASAIFYVSAWYVPRLAKFTGVDANRSHLLPNIVENTRLHSKPDFKPKAFLAVLNLNIWRKKGLDNLLRGFANTLPRFPGSRLQIIGGGSPRSIQQVRNLIRHLGIESEVHLAGSLPNAAVIERMSESMALVLPSHNETFGMVYLEALFAGVPILYSKGTGIDGFLDGLNVGIGVNPSSLQEISHALSELTEHNAQYRGTIVASADELSSRFGREQVISRYQKTIWAALGLNGVSRDAQV